MPSELASGRGIRLFLAVLYSVAIVGILLVAVRPEAASIRRYALQVCGGLEALLGLSIVFDIGGVASRLRGSPDVGWIKPPFARTGWSRNATTFRAHTIVSGALFVGIGIGFGLIGFLG